MFRQSSLEANCVQNSACDRISLNGEWSLAFDPDNAGKSLGWSRVFPANTLPINVPGVWEQVRPGYDGVGWYRKAFVLPRNWAGRLVRVRFGAVQYFCEVWLNGEFLGDHEGGSLPFEFVLPASALRDAKAGANELTVRVINPPIDSEIDGFRCGAPLNQSTIPVGKAGWYYNFGGIWQDVELLVSDRVFIRHTAIEPWPSLRKAVLRIEVESHADTFAARLACDIRGLGGEAPVPAPVSRTWKLRRGRNSLRIEIPFPRSRRWSLDDPFQYVAAIRIEGCDGADVRFGMREFAVGKGRFMLNGRKVVLKGFLHQGSWPRTLVYPDTEAILRRELEQVKAGGFNFVRAHLRPAPPALLDLADELGLLVMAEPPIGWIAASSETERRCWREIEGLFRRDVNHPSVTSWCLMNEVFHLKGFIPADARAMCVRWLERLRALDTTRPVIDVSGGHGMFAIGGVNDMLPDTAKQKLTACMQLPEADPAKAPAQMPIVDAHIYHGFPLEDKVWMNMRTTGAGSELLFVTEYGAPPVPPQFARVIAEYSQKERDLDLEDIRLHRDFLDSMRRNFTDSPELAALFGPGDKGIERWISRCNELRADEMALVTEALRSNPDLAGFCFCQLADASGELFGALDFWRRPKPIMAALAKASSDAILAVFAWPRVLAPGAGLNIDLCRFNDGGDAAEAVANWKLELVDGKGAVVKRWSSGPKAKAGLRLLSEKTTLPANARGGRWHLRARAALKGGAVLAGEREIFVALPPARPRRKQAPIAVDGTAGGRLLTKAVSRLGLGEVLPFSNNFREPEQPVILDCREMHSMPRPLLMETMGQLKKVVQVGGFAVLLEPEMTMLQHLLLNNRPLRPEPMMRPVAHIAKHPLFAGMGLPDGGMVDYPWASLVSKKYDLVSDVRALGGTVLLGAMSPHMWTRPAVFFNGAGIYTLPIGRGTLMVCNLNLLDRLSAGDPLADAFLANIVSFARAEIAKCAPADITPLMSRAIDPITVG